ncbi:MAG: hypothetical protein CSA09_02560, partial [Candidatus Contendobacter odensis]
MGAQSEEPKKVAVVEFSVRGDLPEHTGAIIADLMSLALANTRHFALKDRLSLRSVAKIAKAQELGATGLLDPKTSAELGKEFKLDAVVIGEVSKLGNRINVTTRLIDTKTAALLRGGQIQGKDLDDIQINVYQLALAITAPPETPKSYALIVKTRPTDANVRLLQTSVAYRPGVALAAGEYQFEVTRSGYVPRQQSVIINDRDVTVTVVLEKAKYRLAIQSQPADAKIRFVGSETVYRSGMELESGRYQVEVSRKGYKTKILPVTIADSDVAVPVKLEKIEKKEDRFGLTVRSKPVDAAIRLKDLDITYKPGVKLLPGSYIVEVAKAGYIATQVTVTIVDKDVAVPVTLEREPKEYGLTVEVEPPNARIRLLGIKPVYRPGIR